MLRFRQIEIRQFLLNGSLRASLRFLPHFFRGKQFVADLRHLQAVFGIHDTAFVGYFLQSNLFGELFQPFFRFGECLARLPNLNL